MPIEVNTSKLKQERKRKLWSQEELAIAADLGLRTVQRVESEGSASFDTLKAIASALEIDADTLIADEDLRSHYFNIQPGYTILTVGFCALLICTWQFNEGTITPNVFLSAIAVIAVILSLFATLSIRANNDVLTWYFGIGFWKKTLDLVTIKDARVVKNKVWWGWGIRHYGDGWLYNVSGLSAIELTLTDGRHVRIGSDEPEKLARFLGNHLHST